MIDRLNSLTDSQIDIKVYVLEVDRTAKSNFGISLYRCAARREPADACLIPASIPFIESPRPPGDSPSRSVRSIARARWLRR